MRQGTRQTLGPIGGATDEPPGRDCSPGFNRWEVAVGQLLPRHGGSLPTSSKTPQPCLWPLWLSLLSSCLDLPPAETLLPHPGLNHGLHPADDGAPAGAHHSPSTGQALTAPAHDAQET